MGNKPELLAPAGSLKVLKAAANLGADAVYFGLPQFNARQGAVNFTLKEAEQGISYLNSRGKKAYITLNTLVKDRELPEFISQVEAAAEIGAHGVIVQDLGGASLVKKIAPFLELHGSTQMAVHHSAGVKALEELGFHRVVMAREATLSELREIKKETNLELEVFIHGALCVSYSGQCFMSSFIGERSGNRGRCAQPCRLTYEGGGNKGTLMSLKDMETIDLIPEFSKLQIASLKIEGRLKNEYYVATVVDAYRRVLDGETLSRGDRDLLHRIFYRGGTAHYYSGQTGKTMFCFQKNENPYSSAELEAKERYQERILNETLPHDAKSPLSFKLWVASGKKPMLEASADGKTVLITGEEDAQEAKTVGLTSEKAEKSLSKLGDTHFILKERAFHIEPDAFLPASALNELRRKAVEQLIAEEKPKTQPVSLSIKKRKPGLGAFLARVTTKEQLQFALAEESFVYVLAPVDLLLSYGGSFGKIDQIVATLPRIFSEEELPLMKRQLSEIKNRGITKAAAGNIGHFPLLSGFEILADVYLNLFNSVSLYLVKDYPMFLAGASWELNLKDIQTLLPEVPLFATAYGYPKAMITKNCLKKSIWGKCTKEPANLKDRKGESFLLLCQNGCRNEILNPHPIMMADKQQDLKKSGIDFLEFSFTVESEKDCAQVLTMYKKGENRLKTFTRGHFYRGVL